MQAASEGLALDKLRSLLPRRGQEDIAAGRTAELSFGHGAAGRAIHLPVLSIQGNRAWKEQAKTRLGRLIEQLGDEATPMSVLDLLLSMGEVQLDLVADYAKGSDLDRGWLAAHATDEQLLAALLEVAACAFPTESRLLELVRDSRELRDMLRLAYLRSMVSSPESSDGAPGPSSPTSPMSSSSASSRTRASGWTNGSPQPSTPPDSDT